MPATLKDYLGFGDAVGVESPTSETSTQNTIPVSWYTSQGTFELERRAIFSRKWLLTTHSLRLPKTGDYLKYDIAGYSFILVKDRQGGINAFHNVCRHRAFPVVTDEGGTARIFSCKYHGWSYGLNGNLAKAPGYQDLDGFDKSQNGLLPIHVHIDANGFVWLNLDSTPEPEIAWAEDFKSVDLQSQFQGFNAEDYSFDHAWDADGAFNWKILADGYNERYHGQTPVDVPSLADLGVSSPDSSNATITQYADAKPEQVAQGLKLTSQYYFPNASLTVSPHFFFMQRFVPTGPTNCVMRFEVYRHKDSSDQDFELVNALYKGIMFEDKDLSIEAQKSLSTSEFANDELPAKPEKGSLPFQATVKSLLTGHRKREEETGREIWPARQALPATAATSQEDIDFCSKLTKSAPAGGCCGGMACQSGNATLAY